jgi:hypothetical protein
MRAEGIGKKEGRRIEFPSAEVSPTTITSYPYVYYLNGNRLSMGKSDILEVGENKRFRCGCSGSSRSESTAESRMRCVDINLHGG